jgi:hypothetical protein
MNTAAKLATVFDYDLFSGRRHAVGAFRRLENVWQYLKAILDHRGIHDQHETGNCLRAEIILKYGFLVSGRGMYWTCGTLQSLPLPIIPGRGRSGPITPELQISLVGLKTRIGHEIPSLRKSPGQS